jgi:hypothetical protein
MRSITDMLLDGCTRWIMPTHSTFGRELGSPHDHVALHGQPNTEPLTEPQMSRITCDNC